MVLADDVDEFLDEVHVLVSGGRRRQMEFLSPQPMDAWHTGVAAAVLEGQGFLTADKRVIQATASRERLCCIAAMRNGIDLK